MTRAEIDAFVARPLTCRLGCVDLDGAPYVVPVNYQYEEGAFFVFARERAAWAQYLQGEPRVALCIDLSYSEGRVLVRGSASVAAGPHAHGWPIRDGDLIGEVALRMATRYANGDATVGRETMEWYANDVFWLFRIEPTAITSWMGEWHPRYRGGASRAW
jgi:hypothetical protein